MREIGHPRELCMTRSAGGTSPNSVTPFCQYSNRDGGCGRYLEQAEVHGFMPLVKTSGAYRCLALGGEIISESDRGVARDYCLQAQTSHTGGSRLRTSATSLVLNPTHQYGHNRKGSS